MDVQLFIVVMCGLVGLMVGSFANVCVYRIPRGESVAFPGSHCPACGHDIAWYDNIPLFSWLILGGKCRHCSGSISVRYPFLEALMGISWAWLAYHYGFSPVLLQAIVLISLLWILTLIDLETGLLPNVLTLSGIVIGLLFAWWFGFKRQRHRGCTQHSRRSGLRRRLPNPCQLGDGHGPFLLGPPVLDT